MKLFLKIIGYTVGGILGLIVLAFIALQFISDEQYKKWITAATESATGRTLDIDGELDVQIGTNIGLSAHEVRFGNTQWGARNEMVTADRLLIQIKLLPLIRGILDLTVEVDTVDILMETNSEGTGNWVLDTAKEKPGSLEQEKRGKEGGGGSLVLPVKPYIRNLEVNGLVFVFNDRARNKNTEAALEHLRIFVDGADIPLTLKGIYQGAPIELAGSLGNIEQWHSNQITPVSLNGRLSDAALSIDGTAGPVLPGPSARLRVALTADSVSTFGAFAGIDLPALQGLDASLVFVADEGRMATEELSLHLSDSLLQVSVAGRVADLNELSGIDLSIRINTESGAELLQGLNFEIPYRLPQAIGLKAGFSGSLDSLAVEGLEVTVKDQGLYASLKGALENVFGGGSGVVDLDINMESTSVISKFAAQELPRFGPLTGSAKLTSNGRSYQLESLLLELQDPVLKARIEGFAENIGRSADDSFEVTGIQVSANAGSEQLKEIVDRLGVDVPGELPASFDLKLSSAGSLEKLGITNLQAVVRDNGLDINLTGAVDNVMDLSGIAGQVQGEAANTASLSKYAGMEIPDLGSMRLKGHLSSTDTSLALDSLSVALSGETIEANLSGAIGDVIALTKIAENQGYLGGAGVDLSLGAKTSSVASLAKSAGLEVPKIGALQLDGHIVSTEQSLKLDILKASLTSENFKTSVDVVIEDIIKLAGIKAVIDGDLNSLSSLSDLVQKELPETGPWLVQVQADSDNPKGGPVAFMARIEGEGINGVIDAILPDVQAPETFQAQLAIDVESVARLGALFDKEIPRDKPMKILGKGSGKPGEYRLEEFSLKAEESEMLADLAYLVPPAGNVARKNLTGTVAINNFDLTDFLAAKEIVAEGVTEGTTDAGAVGEQAVTKEKQVDQEQEKKTTGKRIFSDEPLSIGVLHEYDIDLKLHAENIKISDGIDLKGKIAVKLKEGLLSIDPIDLVQTSGGSGKGYIKLDARSEEAALEVALDLDEFSSPRFGGLIDLHVDLDGKGKSLASVMGGVNGYAGASLKDMELKRSFMTQFGAGLLKHLNPLDSDKTILECGVIRLNIKDGIADFKKKMAAQTTEVTWLGGGEINLKTEEVDVGISPKARGAISSLTNIDLASLIHVGGTLAEPRIGLDIVDVAKKYAEYSAFVATGGLSFLAQKVIQTATANVDQCKRILGDLKKQ